MGPRAWLPIAACGSTTCCYSELTEHAFTELYASLGYERCRDGKFQRGFEKIALFAKDGAPTHAAKQLPSGRWSSKLGRWEDITHELAAVAGNALNEYGEVIAFFRRPNANFGRRRWFDRILDALQRVAGRRGMDRRQT